MASDRRNEGHATSAARQFVKETVLIGARNRDGHAYLELAGRLGHPPMRFLEKTPENVLCVPFINAIFPDALFIHLVRDGRSNVSSIIDAWRIQGTFRALPLPEGFNIKNAPDNLWRFLVTPGWRSLAGKRLEEVCATQWAVSNETALDDLVEIGDASRVLRLTYEQMIEAPKKTIETICDFAAIDFDESLQRRTDGALPLSVSTNTRPERDKWKRHNREEILTVYPIIQPVMDRLGYALD